MCADDLFCEEFKQSYPCYAGKWEDHDFIYPDKPMEGYEDEMAFRVCGTCSLTFIIDDDEPDGCPTVIRGNERYTVQRLNLDQHVRDALGIDMVVDITTTGRRSGDPRRIEIWCHLMDGQLYLAASPGPRSWYANLREDRRVTLHLKDDVKADIPVFARPITDEAERRDVFNRLSRQSAFRQGQGLDVETWVRGSRLVELTPMAR